MPGGHSSESQLLHQATERYVCQAALSQNVWSLPLGPGTELLISCGFLGDQGDALFWFCEGLLASPSMGTGLQKETALIQEHKPLWLCALSLCREEQGGDRVNGQSGPQGGESADSGVWCFWITDRLCCQESSAQMKCWSASLLLLLPSLLVW